MLCGRPASSGRVPCGRLLVLVECLAVGLLAVVECLALGLGETVGAASVLLSVSKPEALSRVFVQPSDLEQPAAGLRWVLAYLLLGLCVSVGLKVGVKKLCFCFWLGRVDCARKGSRKRRLPRNPKLRLRVWNRWMRVEVACARMMRVRREPAVVKLGNALRKLAEEVILEAVSHVLMGVNFVLRLLACLGRKMKAWFLEILPFEVRWKSRSSQDCELCLGLPVEVQVEDSDEELIPDPFRAQTHRQSLPNPLRDPVRILLGMIPHLLHLLKILLSLRMCRLALVSRSLRCTEDRVTSHTGDIVTCVRVLEVRFPHVGVA